MEKTKIEELELSELELWNIVCFCILTITHNHKLANGFQEIVANILVEKGLLDKK